MKILKRLLIFLTVTVLLYSTLIIIRHHHKNHYNIKDSFLYSKGNAPDDVRQEILNRLHKFQEGYTKRDTSQVKSFMDDLFSKNNVLVLGTMPREILVGQKRTSRLIWSDWHHWGDCTFIMDNAHISSAGNTAWISTIGYVKFDLCRYLNLPLRLSAVMVNENGMWKFQFMQFQFDLDITSLMFILILLLIWLPISLIGLVAIIIKTVGKNKK